MNIPIELVVGFASLCCLWVYILCRRCENNKPKPNVYTIEYHPIKKRYYALVNGLYIKSGYELTGIIPMADAFATYDFADKTIELYKESIQKAGVEITKL